MKFDKTDKKMKEQIGIGRISVRDHGACGDGKSLDTPALQAAIDAVASSGGGVVTLTAGIYVCGTVFLRSGVVLELLPGAVLQSSRDIKDFPRQKAGHNKDRQPFHFIVGRGCRDIGIWGPGAIDGQGPAFWQDEPVRRIDGDWFVEKEKRPSPMVDLSGCENVFIDNLTLRNSPGWTLHLDGCSKVRIRGLTIDNCIVGPNTDGIDITDSRDVQISDCSIETGDDAIVLKTLGGTCERITITNCILRTNCCAIKLGASESSGTIRQVVCSNVVVHDSSRSIGLYNLRGGLFEDISFSNIVCGNHNRMPLVCPIHIDCCHWGEEDRVGRIRNVRFEGLTVKSDARILLTAETPGSIQNLSFSGVQMEYPSVEIPGELAYKARDLQFSPRNPEARRAEAAIVAENVDNLTLADVSVSWPDGDKPPFAFLWGRNLRGGYVHCPDGQASSDLADRFDLEGCSLRLME